MWTRRARRAALATVLVVTTLTACSSGGGDDDDTRATTTTTVAPANTLQVEMVDHAYKLQGALRPGLAKITSLNTGAEWHMAGFAKLKPDRTIEELMAVLQSRAQAGGEVDPTAEFVEKELGSPGHVLQPGQSQSIVVDIPAAGSYVLRCFLPTEGETTLHTDKGMVAGFQVGGEKAEVKAPAADAAITLADDADPAGLPTELKAGPRTFKITSSGARAKDFAIGQLQAEQPFEAFDTYFETEFDKEGGPVKGAATKAPGTILGSTFGIEPNQTVWITVNLLAGPTYFVNTTNPAEETGEEGVDKFVKVNVT